MKQLLSKSAGFLVPILFLLLPAAGSGQATTKQAGGSTLFRAINCQVMDRDSKLMKVIAFRNMKDPDEVIIISVNANHALIVNARTKKAYKVPKPILGENAVNVSNERPVQYGNAGFHMRTDKNKVQITEIIVYFKDDSCFLCGPTMFAAVWD